MLKSLQMGRGLAALAVAAFHLSIVFADPRYGSVKIFAAFTNRGSLGVDFFFVLSGFIMMYAHHKDIDKRHRLGAYAVKRFVRVYPIYWLFTAIVLLGAAVTNGVNRPPSAIGDILSVLFLIRFTDYAAPIGVSWTLYHEVLFYAIFSLLLFNRTIGIIALGCWLFALLTIFQYAPHGDWSFRNVLLSASNLSFFFGIGAYFITAKLRGIASYASVIFGIFVFCIICILDNAYPGLGNLRIAFSVAFMALIAGTVAMERDGKIKDFPLLGLIGNASYTLYLSHESVESMLLKVASRLPIMAAVDDRITYFIVLALTVIFSIVFYKRVERPLLQGANFILGLSRSRGLQTRPMPEALK